MMGALAGCKYDADNACGPDQVMKNGLCACAEGRVLMNRRCVAPPSSGGPIGGTTGGDEEDAGAGMGLGARCSDDSDCSDAVYSTCVTRNAASGYCSRSGCTTECEPGYFCAHDQATAYCKRTPTGQGSACFTNAECAGKDASYCTPNPSTGNSECVVRDCEQGGCSPSNPTCFDLAMFMPGAPKICIPAP
jgi:hypothetical protein